MADVFISFAPEDRVWAGTLARELSSVGFDVLWDLSPGLGEAQRDVEDELAAAKAIITVWSSASRNSNWVRDVAQEAFERGLLLPVLKDVDKPPLGFRQLRCADLRTWTSGAAGLGEVIVQLRGRVGAAAPQPVSPVEPSQPSDAEELDFERSTIVMKSDLVEPSRGTAATQPSTGMISGVSGAPSTSEKLVSVRLRGGGPGDLLPGDEVGQYRIVRRLGAGGFGAVYEAANIHNEDERVALKLLLADVAASERFAQLLKLEANALLRLKHPAVVQYRVFGRIADSDQFYLVTEFVPGPTLREWRRANTPSLDEVRSVAVRLASGLAAAHKRGIVHRDLAPDNVIVTQGDLSESTLIDFGIARMGGEADALGGAFAGKFSYAAPEQFAFDGTKLGPSIDIYAFGLLMAAFARGKPLDMGRDVEAAKAKRLQVPALDDLPPAMVPVLTRLLQPDPADRPQDMDEVAHLFGSMHEMPPEAVDAGVSETTPAREPAAATPEDVSVPAAHQDAIAPPVEALPDAAVIGEAFSGDVPEGDLAPEAVEDIPFQDEPVADPVLGQVAEAEPRRRSALVPVTQFLGLALVGAAVVFFLLPGGDDGPAKGTPVATVTPVPSAQPTPVPPVVPTAEPTPVPEPTSAPLPTPVLTPSPSPVPEATPTPTPEPTPAPTAEPTPTPQAPLATGKIEAAPRGARVTAQSGKAYGAQNSDGRIVYVARRPMHLTVVAGRREQLIDRDLKKGDSYRLPDRTDLFVSADDAGALDVILDGTFIGRAGPDGARLDSFNVTPVAYGGPAVLPTPVPTVQPTPTPPPAPTPEPQTSQSSGDISGDALHILNGLRSRSGLSRLAGSAALDQVAQTLAANNARAGAIRQPSGSAVLQMLIQSGYGSARASQLHTRRQNSVSEAMQFWAGRGDMAAALLDPDAAAMGIGMAEAGGVRYWVLVVAQSPR